MRKSLTSALLSLAVLSGAVLIPGIKATAEQHAGVAVQANGGQVRISVTQILPLSVVLAEFCEQTGSACEGLLATSNLQVVPMVLNGEWQEVVPRLMQGTGINYIASPPSKSGAGTLIVQVPSVPVRQDDRLANQSVPPTVEPQATAAPPEIVPIAPGVVASSDNQPSISSGDLVPSKSLAEGFSSGQLNSAAVAASGNWSGNPLTHDIPFPASSPETPQYLPFPDSHGNLIPAPEATPGFLLWPDSKGHLIPAPVSDGSPPFPISPR